MNEAGEPSRTAVRVAYGRACHQRDPLRIFEDPLAARVLLLGEGEVEGPPQDPVERYRQRLLAARSRFAEEAVGRAVAAGVRQAVVLGAGLDTFGCRNPWPELTVYEVDHPATQRWKRKRLAEAGIEVPPSLVFAPLDFERGSLGEALEDAGFDRALPACFFWLGVTPYLRRETVLGTLRYVAGHRAPVEIVLDYYLGPSPTMPAALRAVYETATRGVAELGEPWLSHFTPDDLAAEVRALDLWPFADVAGPELVARYLGEAAPGEEFAGDPFGVHLLHAGRRTPHGKTSPD